MKEYAAMAMKRPECLDERLHRFAEEYSLHRNGAKAAIATGYAEGSAKVTASKLLARPDVQTLVAEQGAKLTERTNIEKDWVVRETINTYNQARELGMPAAARSCLHLISLLHGYIVERRDVRVIGSVRDLSDQELAALAAEVIEGDAPVVIEAGDGQ